MGGSYYSSYYYGSYYSSYYYSSYYSSYYYGSYYSSYYYPKGKRYNHRQVPSYQRQSSSFGAVGVSMILVSCLLGVVGTGAVVWFWRQKRARRNRRGSYDRRDF